MLDLDILKANPKEAIELIMDTYGNDVKKFIYCYLKNEADTDDVTQEVFVTVYFKLNTFKGNSSLKNWIYSIAANKCKDYLRKNSLRPSKLIERITKQSVTQIDNDVSKQYEENLDKKEVFKKVMALPIKYREVVILYYFKELSIKEISYILKEKETTLQSRLLRARKGLKEVNNEGEIIIE